MDPWNRPVCRAERFADRLWCFWLWERRRPQDNPALEDPGGRERRIGKTASSGTRRVNLNSRFQTGWRPSSFTNSVFSEAQSAGTPNTWTRTYGSIMLCFFCFCANLGSWYPLSTYSTIFTFNSWPICLCKCAIVISTECLVFGV